jgi:hypothetical protein
MAYIIDVASMDFPDGAQRFNWCNCQTPAALAAGLQGLLGLGDLTDAAAVSMPIVDWSISDLNLLPAAPVSSAPSILSSVTTSLSSYWPILLAALAAWYFFFRKGRR